MNRPVSPQDVWDREEKNLPRGGGVAGDLIDFTSFWSILWQARWLLVCATLLAAVLGACYAIFLKVPLYQSVASVVLTSTEDEVPMVSDMLPGLKTGSSYVNTEAEILRAPSLIARVAADLALAEVPEFNPALRPDGLLSLPKTWLQTRMSPHLPDWVFQTDAAQTEVSKALTQRVSVRNLPDSLVFEIYVQSREPKRAAEIANRLAELYILGQIETKFAATEQATAWLNERVAGLKIDLQAAEARVQDYSTSAELISVESLAGLTRQLKDIRDRHMSVLSDMAAAKSEAAKSRLAARAGALNSAAISLEARISRQSTDLVALEELHREVEASRLIYEFFLGRLKETAVQRGVHKADARILSRAEPSARPASPRISLITAFAALLGLGLSGGFRLIYASRNPVFNSPVELQRLTGKVLLGQIPRIRSRGRKDVMRHLGTSPTSPMSEAVRNLRTSLLWGQKGSPPKVILSTSSLPGEGKTTHSLALAKNLSDLEHRVLVVECDLRKPVFEEVLGKAEKPGLSVLNSKASRLDDFVERPEGVCFDVVFAGRSDRNAADLFTSRLFSRLIGEAAKTYDFVILDAPPVLVVPDARILGQNADAIFYSVKAASTTTHDVRQGLSLLETVGLNVTGLVFSQVTQPGRGYYGYG